MITSLTCAVVVGNAISLIGWDAHYREDFNVEALTYWMEEAGDIVDALTICEGDPDLIRQIEAIGQAYAARLHALEDRGRAGVGK